MWRKSNKSPALCAIWISAICAIPLVAHCAELQRFEAIEPHMGTLFRIVLYVDDAGKAQAALRAAFDRVAQLDAELSDYNPHSELMLASAQAALHPVRVSDDLFGVLSASQRLASESGGAFDVTLGPLIRLWRQARTNKRLPSAEERAEARERTGFRNLDLDPATQTMRLESPGMQIDLGGIAKGYAAEEALRTLRAFHCGRALVAASGDLALGDPPPGKDGWEVRVSPIADPDGTFDRLLRMSNVAVSTSGDREQFSEIGGRRFSHIVDRKTGLGLDTRVAASVVAPRGMDADSLATAACVIAAQNGLDAALAFVARHPGISALILRESSSGWAARASGLFETR